MARGFFGPMTKIIDLNSKRPKSEEKLEIDQAMENHNYVMDICDDIFDYGSVLITQSIDGNAQISVSGIELEEVLEMLVACALKIQNE